MPVTKTETQPASLKEHAQRFAQRLGSGHELWQVVFYDPAMVARLKRPDLAAARLMAYMAADVPELALHVSLLPRTRQQAGTWAADPRSPKARKRKATRSRLQARSPHGCYYSIRPGTGKALAHSV